MFSAGSDRQQKPRETLLNGDAISGDKQPTVPPPSSDNQSATASDTYSQVGGSNSEINGSQSCTASEAGSQEDGGNSEINGSQSEGGSQEDDGNGEANGNPAVKVESVEKYKKEKTLGKSLEWELLEKCVIYWMGWFISKQLVKESARSMVTFITRVSKF